jgi:uncharacterized protein YlxW (UPF0749 family)
VTAPVTAPPSIGTRLRSVRGRTAPLIVIALAAIAGFLLVGQLQGDREEANPLEAEEESDLARILTGLNDEADALQAELAELRVQLNELRRSSESDAAAAAAVDQQLRSLEVLAGTTPVTGPGVVVTISDPDGTLTYDAMIDIVQELRDAGAEAIAINDERVGVATSFAERDGRITANGRALSSPYRVAAIGQATTLEGGLKIPGGAIDAITALSNEVRVDVAKLAKVDLPALSRPPEYDVARPVGSKP